MPASRRAARRRPSVGARRWPPRPDDVAAIGERRCPRLAVASYPRGVTTPTRATRARRRAADPPPPPDSARAAPTTAAPRPTPTAAPATSTSCCSPRSRRRPACSRPTARWSTSSIRRPATFASRTTPASGASAAATWVRSIDLPVGTGMFGQAVATRSVVLTRDYLADEAFHHAEDPDRVVRDIGIRSMVVAPLVAGDTVFGALGTFSSRLDAFSESDIRLVRALSDHAAAAMANARLIEALDASRGELAARADVERSLREINARISAATDLLGGPPADRRGGGPADARRRVADRPRRPGDRPAPRRLRRRDARVQGDVRPGRLGESETLDQGVAGQAVVNGKAFWTGDYLADPRFPHLRAVDEYLESVGIVSVMAVPLDRRDRAVRRAARRRAAGRTPGPRPTPACSRPSPTRPPSPSGRRASSTPSASRSPRSPGAPAPNRRCARSPPGSPSCASRATSCATS